jgi:hypothetical protein
VIGLILILVSVPLLYIVWLRRKMVEKFVPWLSLMLLTLMSAVITGAARLNLGVAQSTASRYTVFSLLYVIGLTGLACALLDTLTIKRGAIALIILAVVGVSGPLLLASYSYGIPDLQQQSTFMQEAKYCTHKTNPSKMCLLLTAPFPDRNSVLTGDQLHYIKAKHWAGY